MEVKWSDRPVNRGVLNELIRKAERLRWRGGEREEIYVRYSRSSFTFGAGGNVPLIDPGRLMEELSCGNPALTEPSTSGPGDRSQEPP